MQRKAFTLIELLVVIAIIAILAAILFPVFAQAKLAAKKTSALSGNKQLTLAILMYNNDSDGLFPLAFQGTQWTGSDLWEQRMQPYTKSIGVFGASADSQAGQVANVGSWAGVGVSFAANSYYSTNWCCSPSWNSGFPLRGPMGIGNEYYDGGTQRDEGQGWLYVESQQETALTQPSSTILIAEKHGDDIAKWNTAYEGGSFNFGGNYSAFAMGAVLTGPVGDGIGWGPEAIPNGQATGWKQYGTNNQIFEYGINGAVSATYAGQATFSFADGHAKSMVPSATDPDPVNQPQNNLWDGLR